jgi:hypothetical protein
MDGNKRFGRQKRLWYALFGVHRCTVMFVFRPLPRTSPIWIYFYLFLFILGNGNDILLI